MHPLEKRILLPQDLQPINTLDEYRNRGGLQGLEKARSMSSEDLISFVKASGLRGRGGAGFPTAIKWETVRNDPYPTKYVVCNAAEGEPGTFKDRYLMSKNPYCVLEGMLIASHAVGPKEAIIGTKKKFTKIVERLEGAIKEFEDAGICEKGFLRLVQGPDDYLFGEEKALMEVIDGRDAMPRFYPPFMVGVGYGTGRPNPTVVNNVESMAQLSHILRHGSEWFRESGTEDTPGTMIITLIGDIKSPGLYEVSLGITLGQLINDLGGGPADPQYPVKAIFSGVSNPVATPELFDTKLEFTGMRKAGFGLGSGGFIVHDARYNMADIALMYSNFLAKSSCGQCIPCNAGTRTVTQLLERIVSGEGTRQDLDDILVECGRCTNQTRCFLPTQESIVIPSIMKKFPDDFKAKLERRQLDAPKPKLAKIAGFDEAKGEFILDTDPIGGLMHLLPDTI